MLFAFWALTIFNDAFITSHDLEPNVSFSLSSREEKKRGKKKKGKKRKGIAARFLEREEDERGVILRGKNRISPPSLVRREQTI